MIGLARSESITGFMHGSRLMNRFSRQFVGGGNALEGVQRADELRKRGISASMFVLGEYEDTEERVRSMVSDLEEVFPLLREAGLDQHVSVDPTQIGSMLSWESCRENAVRLGEKMAGHASGRCTALMVDMEDASVTAPTLDLYAALKDMGLPVAVTIQAYLHRSREDIENLVQGGAMVRLVKGAFAEDGSVALTSRKDIDERYRELLGVLFSDQARESGVYPVIGSHDHRMIEHAVKLADERGWSREQWEVEMLLGVRPQYQSELVRQGVSLRAYLPYGRKWWPYSVRRIGENPRNLWFVGRSVFGV